MLEVIDTSFPFVSTNSRIFNPIFSSEIAFCDLFLSSSIVTFVS